jgi:hypothetical protein
LFYTGQGNHEDEFDQYRKDWDALAKRNPDWLLLPELGPVHKREVKRWMQEFGQHLKLQEQNEIIERNFGQSKTLDMISIENMLEKIIRLKYKD